MLRLQEHDITQFFFFNPTLLYRGISFIVAFAHLVNIVVLFVICKDMTSQEDGANSPTFLYKAQTLGVSREKQGPPPNLHPPLTFAFLVLVFKQSKLPKLEPAFKDLQRGSTLTHLALLFFTGLNETQFKAGNQYF